METLNYRERRPPAGSLASANRQQLIDIDDVHTLAQGIVDTIRDPLHRGQRRCLRLCAVKHAWEARMNAAQELSAKRAKRVFDQQFRIVRQRELVAKLEHCDNSAAVLGRARTVLAGLELSLAEMIAAYERGRRASQPVPNVTLVRNLNPQSRWRRCLSHAFVRAEAVS